MKDQRLPQAAVAQWIEYRPPKPRVVGSIPASRAIPFQAVDQTQLSGTRHKLLHRPATKVMSMPDHLTRRGGVWWVRLVVPVRLRAVAGRREFTRSCRTSDLQAAKAIAAMHLSMWRRQLLMLDPDMHIDFPKLLAPAPALALVDSCTLEDAEAFGIHRDVILKSPGVQLFCRLDQVRGRVCRQEDLERDSDGLFDVGTVPDNIQESIRSGLHELDDGSGAWIFVFRGVGAALR